VNGSELYMTECIGIALYPDDATDASELLRKAGSALHKAKDLGPGSIMLYTPEMTIRSTKRLHLLQQLRNALRHEEFELHFQPKIDLTTARIVGAEALIRWRRPDGTLVSPGEFIPVVESSDLVHPVGRWVLYAALQQLNLWAAAEVPLVTISINIAGPQFARGTLPEDIAAALAATGVAPKLLQIELLESQLLSDPDQTRRQLTAIRALGVSVAIDDFGTGYSSLSYLSSFPVDDLKIDRSFIHNLTENTGNLAIVRATIAMARELAIHTVAEGVETADELALLHRLGCDLVQGYFTGKPQAAADFAQLVSAEPIKVLPPMLFRLITHGVLLVEDDLLQRHLFVAQLQRSGFAVFAVETAEAVWDILEKEDIDVLVTDYRLPGMDGIMLLQYTRERHPEIARIMLSAANEANIPAAAINRGGVFRYLTKPCRPKDLCEAVREGIQLAQTLRQVRH
jgi:EAL domain-containing protein (putative c-di-GMP-specific phosphodiesterase class I)/CheY-like chemotaxis protein